jgi:ParB family chromosome partitioning protein
MTTQVIHNSGNNEWYTPDHYLKLARLFLGEIDLDVASCKEANEVVRAKRYFDTTTNGLVQSWVAENVWMNPPYSRDLFSKFVDKFLVEYSNKSFKKGVILCNNGTETKAGQSLLENCNAALFVKNRIKFLNEDLQPANSPVQGQIMLFFDSTNKNIHSSLVKEFKNYGSLLLSTNSCTLSEEEEWLCKLYNKIVNKV